MSTAFEERFRKSNSRFNGAAPKNDPQPARTAPTQSSSSGSKLLADLLGAAPVDLARVSDHIRSHAEIAELVIGLAGSLLLSADGRVTIEDAAVILGTDRLRVVACMWSIIEKYGEEGPAEGPARLAAGAGDPPGAYCIQGTNWNAQTLYLETFLCWLGLDSPDSDLPGDRMDPAGPTWQAEDFADLRSLLMRDFLALLPTLNPPFSKADGANAGV
jgi:hypothetical protein